MIDWEWYGDRNTMAVFIHLLLIVNHKNGSWRGVDVLRGQKITSVSIIADQLGLSSRNVRTAIKHLKSTGEIEVKTTSHYSMITVIKFDTYNASENQSDKPSDKPVTSARQASDNKQEGKKGKNEKNTLSKTDLVSIMPTDVDSRIWLEFIDMRARKRAEPTERAMNGILNKLDACVANGIAKNDMLVMCLEEGWKGVDYEWYLNKTKRDGQNNAGDQSGHAAAERRLIN